MLVKPMNCLIYFFKLFCWQTNNLISYSSNKICKLKRWFYTSGKLKFVKIFVENQSNIVLSRNYNIWSELNENLSFFLQKVKARKTQNKIWVKFSNRRTVVSPNYLLLETILKAIVGELELCRFIDN